MMGDEFRLGRRDRRELSAQGIGDLPVQDLPPAPEQGLRLGEFGELSGRREALDRRRQYAVRIGVAVGRAIKLRQRQRGAQFEAPVPVRSI